MGLTLDDIFRDFRFIDGAPGPIFAGCIPDPIMDEIDRMVDECRTIKGDSYSELFHHLNSSDNSFQCSVPATTLTSSRALAFILNASELMCSRLFGTDLLAMRRQRPLVLNSNRGHYGDYDFWVNFIYQGDSAPAHTHIGLISGVIYVSGLDNSATRFGNNFSFAGTRGDVILFLSTQEHWVDKKETDGERVTIAFNIIQNPNLPPEYSHL